MGSIGDYYFAHDGIFVIPVEHLTEQGVSREYRELAAHRSAASEEWLDCFDGAYRLYRSRADQLYRQAAKHWFPPRAQHVCIVTDPVRVRPYFQPFHRTSWLLYASDFDPEASHLEFAVFQILQAERMGLLQEAMPVLASNLSYFLTRGDDEIELFCGACRRSGRPDAEAYHALADRMPGIRELYHETLRPPDRPLAEPFVTLAQVGLMVPRSRQPLVEELLHVWNQVVRKVVGRYYAVHAKRRASAADELCGWLRETIPRVLVGGAGGRILWDPERPRELDEVRGELRDVTAGAAESIRADLTVIDRHSRAFVSSLKHPESLPDPAPHAADQNGLSYMHLERREIAYNLREPFMQRLHEPSPPFERWMLGARTVHEWGHLATEAGWVPTVQTEYDALIVQVASLFDEVLSGAPEQFRSICASSLAELEGGGTDPGRALADFSMKRIGDFQSNLVARRYLSSEEIETYVRNNVRSLVQDYSAEGLFQRLARYAYEFQYLRFSAVEDELSFFLESTWFREQYLERGIITDELLDRLLVLVGRVCDTFSVDESRFEPPR